MGGDTFVPEVGGADVEEAHGDALREAWTEEFDELIGEVQPFEGARELLEDVKDRGFPDAPAAGRLSIPTIGVRTGGSSPEELQEAGALTVFDSLVDLRTHLEDTPLGRPSR